MREIFVVLFFCFADILKPRVQRVLTMGCLYCGKESGALRLLRDSEFCTGTHRKNYGARLKRAVHQMATPERAPAGMADYVVRWAVQEGVGLPSSVRWLFGEGRPRPQIFVMAAAPLADDSAERVPVPAVRSREVCSTWMAVPAQPVARLILQRAASDLSASGAPREMQLPGLALSPSFEAVEAIAEESVKPVECQGWTPVPQPTPVFSFMRRSVAG